MVNKQRHITSCGPVAILNALNWKGCSCNYSKIINFAKVYLGFDHTGMTSDTLELGLKLLNIPYILIKEVNLSDIIKEVDRGRAVILGFDWCSSDGHFAFIDKHTKKFIRVWNHMCDGYKTKSPILSKKRLRKYILFTNSEYEKGRTVQPAHAFVIL